MIILASNSPRRKELMHYITDDFIIKSAEVDETLKDGVTPEEAVMYLSKIKALPFKNENDIVIGADTVVCIDGTILGKPENEKDAKRMLRLLSGKTHSVFTGICVIKGEEIENIAVETKVKFFELTESEIEQYVKTGEPLDKAGAYGIQGYGSLLVEGIEGDYFNVVGLPVSALYRVLHKYS